MEKTIILPAKFHTPCFKAWGSSKERLPDYFNISKTHFSLALLLQTQELFWLKLSKNKIHPQEDTKQ